VPATAAGLRARMAAAMKIGELNRAYADGAKAVALADTDLTRLRAALKERGNVPAAIDSAARAVSTKLDSLKPRFRQGFGSPMGRALDLLGALEASSAAPTEAQQRTLEFVTAEIAEDVGKLNELTSSGIPALRAVLNGLPPAAGAAVRPPR
jgi:hypothetical protein